MKNKIITAFVLTFLVGELHNVIAQPENLKAPFWVIEGNINSADYTIIRFYAADSNLIQEERVDGFLIDIQKKKNRKYLDKRLAEVVRSKDTAKRFDSPGRNKVVHREQ